MKISNIHFEEYIQNNENKSLHPSLNKLYTKFPKNIENFRNLIFYGPPGVGKYTQMLTAIKQYSPSLLKYEKKISVTYNKNIYFFKISDIHFEVDLSLLGCNSKLLWNEVYNQFVDIVSARAEKTGIIVCKYFQEVHSELLEIFYSYLQTITNQSINMKFILITEELSFIPDNICNCCEVIHVPRPSRTLYNKCLTHKIPKNIKNENISNIKNINSEITLLMNPHEIICDTIINSIINIKDLKYLKFRDILYDIFIYNLNINDCIWYILSNLKKKELIKERDFSDILVKTFSFFQYYNNNYRPIYHLESYIFYVISKIHEFPTSV
jgi:hypothetical protein